MVPRYPLCAIRGFRSSDRTVFGNARDDGIGTLSAMPDFRVGAIEPAGLSPKPRDEDDDPPER